MSELRSTIAIPGSLHSNRFHEPNHKQVGTGKASLDWSRRDVYAAVPYPGVDEIRIAAAMVPRNPRRRDLRGALRSGPGRSQYACSPALDPGECHPCTARARVPTGPSFKD